MLLKRFKITTIIFLVVCCLIQSELAAAYKSEVVITPEPPVEETTKGGFFSGVKSWFRGSATTTTALPVLDATTPKTPQTSTGTNYAAPAQASGGVQRPPPFVLNPAPMVPLGPRPDTPSTSPWGNNPQQPPLWPQPNPPMGGASGKPQTPQAGSGSSSTAGGTYMPGGAHIPGSAIIPGGSPTSTQKPTQPQSPHTVPNNLPRPGGVPTQNNLPSQNGQSSPTSQTTQNNLPRPGGTQSNYPSAPTAQSNPNNIPRGQAPSFPTSQTTNNQNNFNHPSAGGQPSLLPGFGSYKPPSKSQPSGFDLSYGGGSARPSQPAGRPGFGVPSGTSTTATPGFGPSIGTPGSPTSTTTNKPQQMDFDLRLGPVDPKKPGTPTKEDFPSLPAPRRPSTGGVKEDFPALPAPKSPVPSPSSPVSPPSSPSAWNKPLPTPVSVPTPSASTTPRSPTPKAPAAPSGPGGNGVSFVPHKNGPTTTVRPGFQSTSDGNSVATDAEIQTLTETLYTKEANSQLNLITVNPQGKTRSIDSTDEAPQPLLDVNSKAFENPTVAKMRLLFNNYEQDTLTNEHVTPNERKEENDFLDAVMATSVMRQAMLFLQNKGIVGPDPKTHRDMVKELWFTQYSRGSGKIGSSGFEHVFVNEVKNGTIIGLHNWVYFADEEKAGRLDYKGYLSQLDLGNKARVLKVRFTHNNLNKPVNTLFIGTSPELELALYTVCFKLRPDRTCPVSLGNSKFGVVTYSWRYRGKNLIGSAYPEI